MKTKILSIVILFLSCIISQAQLTDPEVNIPDANFKAALLAHVPTIDLNRDQKIQLTEAQSVKVLEVEFKQITDLTGISSFTALQKLYCFSNELSSLDVSKNTALISLNCSDNRLASLDLSTNTSLFSLDCLDNQLTSLDLSKNSSLMGLDCKNNPNLPLICISTIHQTKFWAKDATAAWSTSCDQPLGIAPEATQGSSTKTLLRILTTLGYEVSASQAVHGLYLYQYSDGSTRKVAQE